MQHRRIPLTPLLNLAGGINHGEGPRVTDGHPGEQANALDEQLEDVRQRQETNHDVILIDVGGVAEALEGGYEVLVEEDDTLRHAR